VKEIIETHKLYDGGQNFVCSVCVCVCWGGHGFKYGLILI